MVRKLLFIARCAFWPKDLKFARNLRSFPRVLKDGTKISLILPPAGGSGKSRSLGRGNLLKIHNGFLLLFFFILTSCYQPERNCQDYKNGKFTFDYVVDSVAKTGVFTRKDDLSIEYYEGKIDSSSVRWINDCEYVVKKINPKSTAEEKPVHIKILTTTDNSYTFEFSIVGNNKTKSKGTAIKVTSVDE